MGPKKDNNKSAKSSDKSEGKNAKKHLCFEATSANQVSKPCYTSSSETIDIAEITDSDGEAGSLSANAGPSFWDTFWEWWCIPDTPDSPSSTGSESECGSGSGYDD